MIRKKVCLLGSFAVGKTSLVRRFVHSIFSERYHTTIGVKIDKKLVQVRVDDGQLTEVTLVLWDVQGEDRFQSIPTSYYRGSSGLLLVADGTRPQTLDSALQIAETATQSIGKDVPMRLLLNKADLVAQWEVPAPELLRKVGADFAPRVTSAKTGDGVDESFRDLTRALLSGDVP
ncbi:Ras family protein [Planctomycetes bacterium Poly30]|uniref:Ras family protein n=1 Tax=Saltatorellus ferox TaxID=2528018 RepID=A0A518ESM4_9BACT|nr:Ras family protein [Planctomycetes bacterium Poly30]